MAELEHGAHVRPLPGRVLGGDLVCIRATPERIRAAVVDILGHGARAYAFGGEVRAALDRELASAHSIASVLRELDTEFRRGLGFAIALVEVDAGGAARFCALGNVLGRLAGPDRNLRLVSRDGAVGSGRTRPPAETELRLEPGEVLVLHTDGVTARFELADDPRLLACSAQEIAETVVGRHGRPHDDAGCLVIRRHAPPEGRAP